MQKITHNILRSLMLFTIAAGIISCGGGSETSIDSVISGGDLAAVQAKKKELTDQQKAINNDIARLDSVIIASRNDENYPLITVHQLNRQDFDNSHHFCWR